MRCPYGCHQEAQFLEFLTTQDKLFLLFFLIIEENIKRLEYYGNVLMLMCYNSVFNLLKTVGDRSFLFL